MMPDKNDNGKDGVKLHAQHDHASSSTVITLPGVRLDENGEPHIDTADKYFRFLGHDRGMHFFIDARGRQVTAIKRSGLATKANLFGIAPLQFWEREFGQGQPFTGQRLDAAINWIIHSSYAKGVFHLERMRGLGAWWDDGRAVIHAGDKLIVNGETTEIQSFDTRYVYEALPALNIDLAEPLSDRESMKLYAFSRAINWERPQYGLFLAGWATIATVCGALPWRPHMLLTGPSGGGKTWVTQQLQKLLGEFVLVAKGETSAAGLRQHLQHDARPVIFDEAEGEDRWTEGNINKILGLMRQASSEDEGRIFKGGQDGKSASYTIRSMFLLSAIRNPITQTADENRITIISLAKQSPDALKKFRTIVEPLSREIFTSEWCAKLRARVIRNLPALRENIEIFRLGAGEFFRSQRMGDQVAPLLAGTYLLHHTDIITPERAAEWIRERDWSEQIAVQEESDEDKVITALFEARIRVSFDRGSEDFTVGELVEAVINYTSTTAAVSAATASATLARHGILVQSGSVVVSNTHRAVKHLLRDTSWSIGWARILKRIDGAVSCPDKKSFAGAQSRATSIPYKSIIGNSGSGQGENAT